MFLHDSIYIRSFNERHISANIDIINNSIISGLTRPCFNNLIYMIHFHIITFSLWLSDKQSCCAILELWISTNSELSSRPFLVDNIRWSISHLLILQGYRWTGHNHFTLEWYAPVHITDLFERCLTDFTDHFTSQHTGCQLLTVQIKDH